MASRTKTEIAKRPRSLGALEYVIKVEVPRLEIKHSRTGITRVLGNHWGPRCMWAFWAYMYAQSPETL